MVVVVRGGARDGRGGIVEQAHLQTLALSELASYLLIATLVVMRR